MESPDLFYFPAGDKPIIDNNHHHFTIDDLLDFSKEDEIIPDTLFDNLTHSSSTLTLVDSCNSSVSGGETQVSGFTDDQFSGTELYVPYDDLAELEWLSNFVEESFSSDDLQNLDLISATKAPTPAPNRNNSPIFRESVLVPGKARSKRSRAAPCDWSSRLLHLSHVNHKTTPSKEAPARKCLHCGSDKTPQWRTGPMGPKTLCNACGVRFKSGRLVPEYRPASSPTFVSAKHSNSHRKVMELRRQKELHRAHQHHHEMITQSSIFDAKEYLISGPHFRHMI